MSSKRQRFFLNPACNPHQKFCRQWLKLLPDFNSAGNQSVFLVILYPVFGVIVIEFIYTYLFGLQCK